MLMKHFKILINKNSLIILLYFAMILVTICYACIIKKQDFDIHLYTKEVKIVYMQKLDNHKNIVPMRNIDIHSKIKNVGIDCYVRFKIKNQKLKLKIDDNWCYRSDGYYYYKKLLKSEEEIEMIQSFYFEELNNDCNVNVVFVIDAIQAANFNMDLTLSNPWGNQTIIKSKDISLDLN